MMQKLVLFCGLLCLGQVSYGHPTAIIIAQYTPIIAKVASEIDQEIQISESIIASIGPVLINSIVDGAQSSMDDQSSILNQIVDDAVKEAAVENKNITCCVNQKEASIKGLNLTSLEECRAPDVIVTLQNALSQLQALKHQLSAQEKLCILQNPIFPLPLKACLDNLIANTNTRLQSAKGLVATAARQNLNSAQQCVQKVLGAFDLQMDYILCDFNNCVDAILSN